MPLLRTGKFLAGAQGRVGNERYEPGVIFILQAWKSHPGVAMSWHLESQKKKNDPVVL